MGGAAPPLFSLCSLFSQWERRAVNYAERARRFLATLPHPAEGADRCREKRSALSGAEAPTPAGGTDTGREKSEQSEESPGRGAPPDPAAIWWKDSPAATAPISWIPPRECVGPVACARLGPCVRHAAGRPCRVAAAEGVTT